MLVDLSRVSVLSEQPSEDPHSSHPLDLGRESRVGGTLPLSGSGVSSLALRGEEVSRARSRVDRGRLNNDVSILDELGNSLSRVGVRDLGRLLGVEPDWKQRETGWGAKVSDREGAGKLNNGGRWTHSSSFRHRQRRKPIASGS